VTGLDEDLAGLVEALKNPEPERRPAAVDVARRLRAMRASPARRRRRRWLAAVGFAAVLAAAVLVLWPGDDGPLLPHDHGPVTVAVLPVGNATGAVAHDWVELGLARLVGEVLAARPGVAAVPVSASRARLTAAGLRSDAVPDAEAVDRLRTGLGADVLVWARLEAAGDGVALHALVRAPGGREATLVARGSWLATAAEALVSSLAARLALAGADSGSGPLLPADPYATLLCGMGLGLVESGDPAAALRHLELCLERAPDLGWARRAAEDCRRALGEGGEEPPGGQGR
jgi:hypothetical protein